MNQYTCPECDGRKKIDNDDGYGNLLDDSECFYIDGTPTGYSPKRFVTCPCCGGKGKISLEEYEAWKNYDPNLM